MRLTNEIKTAASFVKYGKAGWQSLQRLANLTLNSHDKHLSVCHIGCRPLHVHARLPIAPCHRGASLFCQLSVSHNWSPCTDGKSPDTTSSRPMPTTADRQTPPAWVDRGDGGWQDLSREGWRGTITTNQPATADNLLNADNLPFLPTPTRSAKSMVGCRFQNTHSCSFVA